METETVLLTLAVGKEKRANLRKLAKHLLKPKLNLGFSMGCFRNSCDTAGCAVGHGPWAGMPMLEKELWSRYWKRVFLGEKDDLLRLSAYNFLFDSGWEWIDNTPQGAAQRIIFALKHGIPLLHEHETDYIKRVQKILKEHGIITG